VTTQESDQVYFEGSWFAVTAVDGTGLFDPATYGLEPRAISTGCYHGYVCRYAIVERQLVLRELDLGSDDEPPPLGGVQSRHDDEYLTWHYQGLDMPVSFTGRLLVGSGDIPDRPYLNMGFWPAWMYREVRELTLRAGELVTAADCSEALAAVRAEVVARPEPGEPREDWVSRTFSLAYDYSWPGRTDS
jgi:hypothetical protein